jgi:hypothetical protein
MKPTRIIEPPLYRDPVIVACIVFMLVSIFVAW